VNRYDRVIGIYDSYDMKLDTALTFFVPEGMSKRDAYDKVMKTPEFDSLNRECGGEGDVRGDVGIALWKLPRVVLISKEARALS